MTRAGAAIALMRARLWRRAPRWMVAVVVRLMGWSGKRGPGNRERPDRAAGNRLARSARWFRVSRSLPSIERPHEGVGRVVLELGVVAEEGQLHRIGGAVSLLADDDLGQAFVRRFLVVVLVAVDE